MNHKFTFEWTHLASGDYDTLLDKNCDEKTALYSDCGSLQEHLKRNSCPKKHGEIGDCHYELYVQQEIIINENDENKASNKTTLDKKLNEYLEKKGITEFNSNDFEQDCISNIETNEPESVSEMKIVHEKLYYDNDNED